MATRLPMSELISRLKPARWRGREVRYVRKSIYLSQLNPNTVLWEDWTVDARYIELGADGKLRLKGFECFELVSASFKPLAECDIARAQDGRGWIKLRRHPRVEGILCLCESDKS